MVAPSNVAADQLALQADRAAALAFGTGATAQRLKVVRYQGAGKVAAQEIFCSQPQPDPNGEPTIQSSIPTFDVDRLSHFRPEDT